MESKLIYQRMNIGYTYKTNEYFQVANNWDQPFYTQPNDNIESKYSL